MPGEDYLIPSGVRRDRNPREVGGPALEVGGVQTAGATPVAPLLTGAMLSGGSVGRVSDGVMTVLVGQVQNHAIKVATVDSLESSKADADFVVGPEDDASVVIAEAIATCYAQGASGGVVQLFEGTFDCQTSFSLPYDVVLCGVGVGVTRLSVAADGGVGAVFVGSSVDVTIRDLTIEGAVDGLMLLNSLGSTQVKCERVEFKGYSAVASCEVALYESVMSFLDCRFVDVAITGTTIVELRFQGCVWTRCNIAAIGPWYIFGGIATDCVFNVSDASVVRDCVFVEDTRPDTPLAAGGTALVYDCNFVGYATPFSLSSLARAFGCTKTTGSGSVQLLDATDDTGWLTSGIVAATGWSMISQRYRRVGPWLHVYAVVERTGSNITVGVTGDITNTTACTLPSGFRPTGYGQGVGSGASGRVATWYVATTGAVDLVALAPGADIVTTNQLSFSGVLYVG